MRDIPASDDFAQSFCEEVGGLVVAFGRLEYGKHVTAACEPPVSAWKCRSHNRYQQELALSLGTESSSLVSTVHDQNRRSGSHLSRLLHCLTRKSSLQSNDRNLGYAVRSPYLERKTFP